MEIVSPIKIVEKPPFIPVDEWVPAEQDRYFKFTKGAIILPITDFFGVTNDPLLDYFAVSVKRSYNSQELKEHLCLYLNYFLKFYDTSHELLMNYYNIKYMIDYVPEYGKDAFTFDLNRYILNGLNYYRVRCMNSDNYKLDLDSNVNSNQSLKYTDRHGMILMECSILFNMIIPLLCQFVYVKKIRNVKEFILYYVDIILAKYKDEVDIYNKLYESVSSNVDRNKNAHPVLWSMQTIRAKNAVTYSLDIVNNILLQILPKYVYNENLIKFNYSSINTSLRYQITDIGYEYSFIGLSSFKRDADNTSEFDKYENHLTKSDESLYIMNKVACEATMRDLEAKYGPFDQEEVSFYMRELSEDSKGPVNQFQMGLIFNLFYKYFGDPITIKAINAEDYIKLMLIAKKILEANKLVIMPYIITSKINRLVTRKSVNKKELQKLETSQMYELIKNKYRNEKIEKYILSIVANILASEFQIVDYDNADIHGKIINVIPDMLIEEILIYISLI